MSHSWPTMIILHIHPNDPIPLLAYSERPAGVPLLFFNHADHVFSLGVSFCDAILDFRRSGQNISKLERCQDNQASFLLPIQLLDPLGQFGELSIKRREKLRREARRRLDIGSNVRVALTVGHKYKYEPALGFDFARTAEAILTSEPSACIIAIGIPNSGRWQRLSNTLPGRFRALGRIESPEILSQYYMASNIFLEGFPFSSLTAMLEAGLYMLPVQRFLNTQCPLLSGDDRALDHVIPAVTSEDAYVAGGLKLLRSPNARLEGLGLRVREEILNVHCGASWIDDWLSPFIQRVMSADVHGEESAEMDADRSETADALLLSSHECLALLRWERRVPAFVTLEALSRASQLSPSIRTRLLGHAVAQGEPFSSLDAAWLFVVNVILTVAGYRRAYRLYQLVSRAVRSGRIR